MMIGYFISILSCISLIHAATIINKEVNRVIDVSSNILKVSTTIKTSMAGDTYDVVYPNDAAIHLAFISAATKGGISLNVDEPVTNGNYTIYRVNVNEPSPILKVFAVFTNLLEPFPAEITQMENQYIRLKDSHYFYSPYKTESQKTIFKLASSNVESFTKLSPFSTKGSSLQFGPYENVSPYTISPATVHYMNNFPFAKFSSMTKELEVSHWGSITVEEIYELHHVGAKLKGGFSRIDYQMSRGASSPSFKTLTTSLPARASNIYYRDQIGNISTSELRFDKDGDLELEVEMRFPMFGGWKTQFYIGYSIPTEIALYQDSTDRYNLKLDFYTAFEDVWVEDMELKVVLPEGVTDVQVNVPYTVEQSRTKRFTYLDSELNGGRTVIILKAKNLVEEHDKQVHISYSFSRPRILVEPFMLVMSYLMLFLVFSVLARTTSSSPSASHSKNNNNQSADEITPPSTSS